MRALLGHRWLIAVAVVVLVFAFAAVAFAQTNGTTTPSTPGGQSGTAPGGAAPNGRACDGNQGGAAAPDAAGTSYSPSGSL